MGPLAWTSADFFLALTRAARVIEPELLARLVGWPTTAYSTKAVVPPSSCQAALPLGALPLRYDQRGNLQAPFQRGCGCFAGVTRSGAELRTFPPQHCPHLGRGKDRQVRAHFGPQLEP